MQQLSDEQLVAEYLSGKETALAVLIQRHTKSVLYFVARFCGFGSEAEDVTQEVFIKVWKNLKKFDKTKKFKTWLYRIARNTAIDHLRTKKQLVDLNKFSEDEEDGWGELPDFTPSAFDSLVVREQVDKVQAAIAELPEIYRTVLDLYFREELSLAEIAEVLDEPVDTIKSRHRRGVVKLKEQVSIDQIAP